MMVNKNILIVLLFTFGFLQAAENDNQQKAQRAVRQKIVLLVQERVVEERLVRIANVRAEMSGLHFSCADLVNKRAHITFASDRRASSTTYATAVILGAILTDIAEEIEQLQTELERDRDRIFKNQKNRPNQNAGQQKYAHISTKKQKKYNNGKHRNNSGR